MVERWRWCARVVTCLQLVDLFLWVFARLTKADIDIVVLDDVHCRHFVHAGFVSMCV